MLQTTPPRLKPISALRDLLTSEAGGGLVLMAVAVAALAVANSPLADAYFATLKAEVAGLSVLHWINDALMAVFFLLVGLEIKREMLDGELATWPRRALPGIAALGGMIAPALIYGAVNAGEAQRLRGWAIPAATDIAFALGVLSLLGSRLPVSLKVFLTALAILDDLGAIAIIALFYSADVSALMLVGASAALGVLVALNRLGVARLWPYGLVGILVWFFVLESGIHATLAGVAVALTIPLRATPGRPEAVDSPLHRLEHRLQPWSAYLIVPIFGFANAGVALGGLGPSALLDTVPLGVALGLFLGKQIGVMAFSWAAVRLKLAQLPAHATWLEFYGVAILCGIGFTMSLFIGALAFVGSPVLSDAAKIGVLAGSFASALVGWGVLRLALRHRAPCRGAAARPATSIRH